MNDSIKSTKNENKVFEIGSISKVFTASVLASLIEEEKINLMKEIQTYYPFSFKDDIKISFKNLANHTSGLSRLPENLDLGNEHNPYADYDEKKLYDYLQHILKMENEAGTTYTYSNLGYGLLSHTLGLSQKTSFQNLLQERIFDKYNMTNSYTNSENLKSKLVKGQDASGAVVPNWDFDIFLGAGGILSTTEDLAKFALAQFDKKNNELKRTRISTFEINENMSVGLGWHILNPQSKNSLFWHTGGTGGYSSSIFINPDKKTSAIVLSNVSAFHPETGNIENLCFELIHKISN
ncbi:MAG: serine hydrolase domain-containing protein [Cruoricaptor ignavus]|nr:serine hydrolase domain-containing protein [Cruoricaptor ignavus]